MFATQGPIGLDGPKGDQVHDADVRSLNASPEFHNSQNLLKNTVL